MRSTPDRRLTEGYRSRQDYYAGEAIPVVIDGQLIGQVAVDDIAALAAGRAGSRGQRGLTAARTA